MFKISTVIGIFLGLVPINLIEAQSIQSPSSLLLAEAEVEETFENAVLVEINQARTNPQAYADWLETLKPYYNNNQLEIPETKAIATTEGIEALDSAIDYLRSLSPLNPLTTSSKLDIVARRILNSESDLSAVRLAQSRESVSTFPHNLSYGQNAKIVVMQLIVDDGDSDRSSRERLFREDLMSNGIACDENQELTNVCAITYSPTATGEAETVATNSPNPIQSITVILQEQGFLEEGDEIMPSDDSLYDFYTLEGNAGQSLVVMLESQEFDTFLAVIDEDNNIIEQNDDINESDTNSTLTVTLPKDGRYYIIVNSYDAQGRGSYTLRVEERE